MHYGPVMIDLEGAVLSSEECLLLAHPKVGGVLLFARNYQNKEQLKALVKAIRAAVAKPLLIAVDHEGGRVWRFKEGFSRLPPAKQYGLSWESDQAGALKEAYEAGFGMAQELLECGLDLSLAPVLDLDSGLSEVIGDRAFHADPVIATELATAFIKGMNAAGMQATGKHFPGHGGCVLDSHIAKPIDDRALEILYARDLIPFQRLQALLGAVMPSHVIYPSVDSLPAGFSKRWLQDILRDQLGFKGAVISDCLSMKGASVAGDLIARGQSALEAGCDMVIVCQQSREEVRRVLEGLSWQTHDQASQRLASMAGQFDQTRA